MTVPNTVLLRLQRTFSVFVTIAHTDIEISACSKGLITSIEMTQNLEEHQNERFTGNGLLL